MNMHNPTPPATGSLLERAAAAYGFDDVATAQRMGAEAMLRADHGGEVAVDELRENGFLLPDAPVTALAEEFRIVKRQLLLEAATNDRSRLIMIASAAPDEGKTFCAVNLALSIAAERDTEVLLVDADFAKPEILSTLGLAGEKGLMDAIVDRTLDVESCVIRTSIPSLSVLPAGKAYNDATELLASERMREVLDRLLTSHSSRVVIFDTPPVLAASAASELALHVGQVLMVVRADTTTEAGLRDAIGLLSGCDQIRLLLNRVRFAPGGPRFGAYYGYGN
jgi:exopolysaccharide/PEP-CTERM locus tyrosine autokinase